MLWVYVICGVVIPIIIFAILVFVGLKCRRRSRPGQHGGDINTGAILTQPNGALGSRMDKNDSQEIIYSSVGEGGGRIGHRPAVDNGLYAELKTNGAYPDLLSGGLYDIPTPV